MGTVQEIVNSVLRSPIGTNVLVVVGVALVLVGTYLAKRFVDWLFAGYMRRFAEMTSFKLDDVIVQAATRPVSWAVVLAGLYAASMVAGLRAPFKFYAGMSVTLLALVFLLKFIDGLAEHVKPHVQKTQTTLDDAVFPALKAALKVFVVVIAVLWVINGVLGYSINSILAGLGIGGLAVALAAQATLSNWFGAITIFADRPFCAGEVVTIADVTGTVEQVGLRSTGIRTADGTLVHIPNATVASSKIENISRMPGRRFSGVIGITYDTPTGKVEAALAAVRNILTSNPGVREGFLVRFEDFGDSALRIRVVYVTKTADYGEFMALRETVNLAIMREFEAIGVAFAFPTQTIHIRNS